MEQIAVRLAPSLGLQDKDIEQGLRNAISSHRDPAIAAQAVKNYIASIPELQEETANPIFVHRVNEAFGYVHSVSPVQAERYLQLEQEMKANQEAQAQLMQQAFKKELDANLAGMSANLKAQVATIFMTSSDLARVTDQLVQLSQDSRYAHELNSLKSTQALTYLLSTRFKISESLALLALHTPTALDILIDDAERLPSLAGILKRWTDQALDYLSSPPVLRARYIGAMDVRFRDAKTDLLMRALKRKKTNLISAAMETYAKTIDQLVSEKIDLDTLQVVGLIADNFPQSIAQTKTALLNALRSNVPQSLQILAVLVHNGAPITDQIKQEINQASSTIVVPIRAYRQDPVLWSTKIQLINQVAPK